VHAGNIWGKVKRRPVQFYLDTVGHCYSGCKRRLAIVYPCYSLWGWEQGSVRERDYQMGGGLGEPAGQKPGSQMSGKHREEDCSGG